MLQFSDLLQHSTGLAALLARFTIIILIADIICLQMSVVSVRGLAVPRTKTIVIDVVIAAKKRQLTDTIETATVDISSCRLLFTLLSTVNSRNGVLHCLV